MNVAISPNFKKMTSKAIFAIVLFVLVYLVLLSLSVSLTVLCVVLGISLIILKPAIITISLGIGLASLGFFILVFLFKFLFKKHEIDKSDLIEITESQEPVFFQFIADIVKEVETDFPKRVYLSSDVNASVFYDSNFWSMFFPIRKNLQIGLGLVNTISEQEFKAILAHEFGHFSQRSMKVGSYVYNVNQVIFNMLYDNESFDDMIQKWANVIGYLSFFLLLAVKLIQGIQWILQKMYDFVNLSYMALSREMEFHADEVAAHVAGSLPLAEALLRIDLANYSYSNVIDFYNGKIENNLKSSNIYSEQKFVMEFLAKESKLPFKNNLPLVSEADLNKYNKSKLNIKNQWASHPSIEERIAALEKLNIDKESSSNNFAIALFAAPKRITEEMTAQLFSTVKYAGDTNLLEFDNFQHEFSETFIKNSFPKEYGGYYDNKNPIVFDVQAINAYEVAENLETLFGKENLDCVYDLISLENDKNDLTSIANKQIAVKTFDYAGQKYNAKEAQILIPRLEQEIVQVKEIIAQNDLKIYKYFYQKALPKGNETVLRDKYIAFFELEKGYEKKVEIYTKLIHSTTFIRVNTPPEQIESNFRYISALEIELKAEIKALLENKSLEKEITKSIQNNFEAYLPNDLNYFQGEMYLNENLQLFFEALGNFAYLLARSYFLAKLDLLNYQINQIENAS
jgi:Zn-dependent protease with chaperone function